MQVPQPFSYISRVVVGRILKYEMEILQEGCTVMQNWPSAKTFSAAEAPFEPEWSLFVLAPEVPSQSRTAKSDVEKGARFPVAIIGENKVNPARF